MTRATETNTRAGQTHHVVLAHLILVGALISIQVSACAPHDEQAYVVVDGSSTVHPLSEAIAAEFERDDSARAVLGYSGTGGGLQRLCRGEIHIAGASRPISASEDAACREAGVAYVEIPIAYDGIVVAVHRDNDWVGELSVDELARIWSAAEGERIARWSDVRDDWPDQPIRLFGPGVSSGTHDYFSAAILGPGDGLRSDFTASEDDNVLVRGVAGDRYALGYFGYTHFAENADQLRAVAIDAGDGPVTPTPETIADGSYRPLTRPVFLYAGAAALEHPPVRRFLRFYLERAPALSQTLGFAQLSPQSHQMVTRRVANAVVGSPYGARGVVVDARVDEVLEASAIGR